MIGRRKITGHRHARDHYREIYDGFRWHVPAEFNIADVCGRAGRRDSRIALHTEDEHGRSETFTYAALMRDANRLSNALAALGVGRGDRVAILLPQRAETAVAHLACYQMGAVAMPMSILFGPERSASGSTTALPRRRSAIRRPPPPWPACASRARR